jgi:HK97 family phage prohead protease
MNMTERTISESTASGNKLSGYAIRYNEDSTKIYENGRLFTERIASGAFDKSLSGDIKLYYNHDKSMPLARTSNGSLSIRSDDQGLFFEAELPNTTLANDIKELMRVGTLTGQMSFGFFETAQVWSADKTRKTVTEGKLVELSIVVDPAYPTTSSSLRCKEINTKRIELIRRKIN